MNRKKQKGDIDNVLVRRSRDQSYVWNKGYEQGRLNKPYRNPYSKFIWKRRDYREGYIEGKLAFSLVGYNIQTKRFLGYE